MSRKRKGKQKPGLSPMQNPPVVSCNGLSSEELKSLIVKALIEFDNNRVAKSSPTLSNVTGNKKTTVKWALHLLVTNAKKLHLTDGPVSTVKVITSLVCSLFAWFGYFIAFSVFVSALIGIYQICNQPSLSSVLSVIVPLFISLIIALISKILSVTSIEIEKNTESNVIFGVSGFFMSLATLILTAIAMLIDRNCC